MISVQECRKYLGDKKLTDEQIELMRNFLYRLAKSKIKAYAKN